MKRVVFVVCVLLLPVALGNAQSASETTAPAGDPPAWLTFDEAVAAAQKSGKFVLVDVYAPWCGWCAKMQKEVYTDASLKRYLSQHFEIARLNIDDDETRHAFKGYELTSRELGYGLGAEGTPTTVFLEANGDYITRLPGYQDLQTFMIVLRYIGTEAFREQTFEEFVEASTH